MKTLKTVTFLFVLLLIGCSQYSTQNNNRIILNDTIMLHPIHTDTSGMILPWLNTDLNLLFDSLIGMMLPTLPFDAKNIDLNEENYARIVHSGLSVYYYTANKKLFQDLINLSDLYHLYHLQKQNSGTVASDLFLPAHTAKASIALIKMYKLSNNEKYLHQAIENATVITNLISTGDSIHSPLPYSFETSFDNNGKLALKKNIRNRNYTTDYSELLELYDELFILDKENKDKYKTAFNKLLKWMNDYPIKNQQWESINNDSVLIGDGLRNASSFSVFILQHQHYFPSWPKDYSRINQWIYAQYSASKDDRHGVITLLPESELLNTVRQTTVDLTYNDILHDSNIRDRAIRQLIWASYAINEKGYSSSILDNFEFISLLIRSMALEPMISPKKKNRILKTTSVLSNIAYEKDIIRYYSFHNKHQEVLHLSMKPKKVIVGGMPQMESDCSCQIGWHWLSLEGSEGILTISTDSGNETTIVF